MASLKKTFTVTMPYFELTGAFGRAQGEADKWLENLIEKAREGFDIEKKICDDAGVFYGRMDNWPCNMTIRLHEIRCKVDRMDNEACYQFEFAVEYGN